MRTSLSITLVVGSAAALLQIPATLQTIPYQLTHLLTPPRPAGKSLVVVPEVNDAGFWFADYAIGADQKRSMLIDTGSSDVYLNPGRYHPGTGAKDTGRQFSIGFATTNPDGSGSESLSGEIWQDNVTLSTLSVPNQKLGNTTKTNVNPPFPHDGLVGFAGINGARVGTPWFQSVCNAGLVSACRFGLAFKTDGTGAQTLGGVDPKYASSLSTVSIASQWESSFDVVAGTKTLYRSQDVQFDSGTTVVYGPIDQVKAVYKSLGIPTIQHGSNPSYLYGYYSCDKPPTIGFTLGGKTFNVASAAFPAKNNGNNNCTGVVQGTDGFGQLWLVGQAFFQGKYVDHDLDGGKMGFTYL